MKTLRLALILLTGCALLFTACRKSKDFVPALNVDKTTVNASNAATKDTIRITSNTGWSIKNVPDWLTITPLNGQGDALVEVSFNANEGFSNRSATLWVSGTGIEAITKINITQMGSSPSLLVDKTTLQEKGEGQQDSISITSNVPWKIEWPAEAGWITADKLSGAAGTTKIYFTVAANTSGAAKSTVLTVSSTGTAVPAITIAVSQPQPEVVINSFTTHAPGGATIIIGGTGFSAVPADNKVKINGTDAVVTAASATELDVTVPMQVGSGPVSVTVTAKSASTTTNFIYDWQGVITTFAGKAGIAGNDDLTGTAATFNGPSGIAADNNGNIYVADQDNHIIRKITPSGQVSTFAGHYGYHGHDDNTTGTQATFYYPSAVAVDQDRNVYVADASNQLIRKITPAGSVSTLAGKAGVAGHDDGNGTSASFYFPQGVAVDSHGNVYVADAGNHLIRKITPSGDVTTLAGTAGVIGHADGNGTAASFNYPSGITTDESDNIYVSDRDNSLIRKITPSGTVTTIAGKAAVSGHDNGTGTAASFNYPTGIAVDNAGIIYVADANNQVIRRIDASNTVSQIAGQTLSTGHANGTGENATFYAPVAICSAAGGKIYIAEKVNHLVRKMTVQ